MLPTDSALVELIVFHDRDFGSLLHDGDAGWRAPRLLAFVIPCARTAAPIAMIDLGETATLTRLVGDAMASHGVAPVRDINAGSTPSSMDATALRERVWEPIVQALGDATQIFVSPDGDLVRVPFGILPDRDRGDGFLLDRYTFVYLSAGRDVLRLGQRGARSAGPPLVIGDPDFDAWGSPAARLGGDRFPRLKATAEEARFVGRTLGVTPALGADALERAFKAARLPRVIHLATHAFFTPLGSARLPVLPTPTDDGLEPRYLVRPNIQNPLLRSGIAFAGANSWLAGGELPEEAEDGLLYAEDVTGLDLTETELVVLSACKTALGEIDPSEGVFGLQRVFALAGARTMVMSLWSVPDQETHQLMVAFYRGLAAGLGCAGALRAAQLELRASGRGVAYWGAFICQGDPGPISFAAMVHPDRQELAWPASSADLDPRR